MTIIELAKELNVTRQTIYNRIKSGTIKARRDFSGRLYISKGEALKHQSSAGCSGNLGGYSKD